MMLIKRGDIFYADLDPIIGSEQGGIRPVIVGQNNVGNKYSPTLVVLPLSAAKNRSFQRISTFAVQNYCPRTQSFLRSRYAQSIETDC